MKKFILAAALAVTFTAGCVKQGSETYQNSSGSIALSTDDSLVYAVDTDNEIVAVIDVATQEKLTEVKVGAAPENIVVGPDDTLYVTNRGARSVSVIKKGEWTEFARVGVGVEPTGLAVSPDGEMLYVVNSTSLESADYGTLTAIDAKSLQVKWDLPLGEEPRGITLTDNGKKALVTLFKQGDVVQVDLNKPEVMRDNTRAEIGAGMNGTNRSALYLQANKSALNQGAAPGDGQKVQSGARISSFHPRAANSITTSPDGKTSYMTVQWAREDNITVAPNNFGGYYASGGPCSLGAVATPGLVTYNSDTAEPVADDITACAFQAQDENAAFPPSHLRSKNASDPLQGPVATIVDPTGAWLFVLARESENVVVMPTSRRTGDDFNFGQTGSTIREQIKIGKGANGIAITRDGRMAFVNNQFDHKVSVLRGVEINSVTRVVLESEIRTAVGDSLTPELRMGRELFFTATNADINNPSTTGVSCNTCHSEGGREDGHVWGFPDGKRQTPALSGRMMSRTAPYHWSGEFDSLQAFMQHTTVQRMGGKGIDSNQLNYIVAYMDMATLAENPHQSAAPTESQLRGGQVFQKAGCQTCHGGEAYTLDVMADVGTMDSTDTQPVTGTSFGNTPSPLKALNTPSLIGLSRTAPYLHNGTALTIRDRIFAPTGNMHGNLGDLSDAEKDDLVEFLKTL